MESSQQTVQRLFKDFSKRSIDAILDMCTDDVIWESYENPAVPFAGTFEGKEGVRRFFERLTDEVDYTAIAPREYCCDGDKVVALGRHLGKARRTGKPFDHDWAMVFRFRDSRISSYFCFFDTREQAEAFQGSFDDIKRKEVLPTSATESKGS